MSEQNPIPVAVVGVGNMGSNHVRVYDELPESDLVEVVEPDPDRASSIRDSYDVTVHEKIEDLSEATAVTVAVPNQHHRAVAETCLEAGLNVLVEKPLALTVEDATAIVETAREHDAILQVGHIERFNPAVQMLREILQYRDIIALESHRMGPFNEHLSEETVIFDLMIHDLDIISSLVDSSCESISAYGADPKSRTVDHAVAQMQFENGVLGTLTASHVTHGKVRNLSVVTDESYITVDYQKQDITIQQTGQEGTTSLLDKSGYRRETVTESPYVQTREPLKIELEHFLDCVRTNSTPQVDGEIGIEAVRLARTVANGIRKNGVGGH